MLPRVPVPASVLVLFSEFCNCAQPRFSMTCCFGFRKRRGCKPQRREIRLFKQRHPQAAQIASKMLWSVLAASKRTDFLSSLNPAIIPQVPTMAMWNETHTVPAVAQHCQSSGSHCRLPWTNIKPSVCLGFFASHYIKFHSREDLASWKRCAWVDLAITFRWFLFLKNCSCPCFIFAGPLSALPSFNLLTPHLKGANIWRAWNFPSLNLRFQIIGTSFVGTCDWCWQDPSPLPSDKPVPVVHLVGKFILSHLGSCAEATCHTPKRQQDWITQCPGTNSRTPGKCRAVSQPDNNTISTDMYSNTTQISCHDLPHMLYSL